jgi:hypothetical protein
MRASPAQRGGRAIRVGVFHNSHNVLALNPIILLCDPSCIAVGPFSSVTSASAMIAVNPPCTLSACHICATAPGWLSSSWDCVIVYAYVCVCVCVRVCVCVCVKMVHADRRQSLFFRGGTERLPHLATV